MAPWINYHHLYYFKTIAEEGGVSAAAKKLRLGQPTLSAQLKQFENVLGVRLFERRNKRLYLTEQGQVALDYARTIFRTGAEMFEVLHDRLKPLRPTLHLGSIDSVPKQVTLQLVRAALRTAPCQVTLLEGRMDELLRELSTHRVDLLLTNHLPMGPEARGLAARSITKKSISFFGTSRFRRAREGFPKSISGVPLIVPTYDSKLRFDLDHWAKLNKIELNVVVESQDISVKKLMAGDGLGLIAAAPHSVQDQVQGAGLIEIGKLQGVFEELVLISAKRKLPNPISAHLFESFQI